MIRALLASTLIACTLASQQVGPPVATGTATAPEQKVAGSVTDQGKPVAGAEVFVLWRRYPLDAGHCALAQEVVSQTVQTAADGSFEATVAPWRWVSVWARKGDRTSAVTEELRTPIQPVRLELDAGCRIAGRLTFGGKPLAQRVDYRLRFLSTSHHGVPVAVEGRTDTQGVFDVPGLARGTWVLQLGGADYRLPQPMLLESGKDAAPAPIPVAAAIQL